MNNPYSPPHSQLEPDLSNHRTPSVFWKIFFWFNILLCGIVYPFAIAEQTMSALDTIDMLMTLAGLVGIYGYIRQKWLNYSRFWKGLTIAYVVWFLLYTWILPMAFETLVYGENPEMDTIMIITVLISGCTVFGLYKFAFTTK